MTLQLLHSEFTDIQLVFFFISVLSFLPPPFLVTLSILPFPLVISLLPPPFLVTLSILPFPLVISLLPPPFLVTLSILPFPLLSLPSLSPHSVNTASFSFQTVEPAYNNNNLRPT
jgi:hypothetical protein